jgi:putative ABC transport system permease protein
MAARNIARNSRRAAATAMALTIGLTVVAAVTVTASSLKESVSDSVTGGNRSDLILSPAGAGIGISPAVADLLRSRDDVDTVVELRESVAQVNGDSALVTGLDTAGLDRVIDFGIESGTLADMSTGTMLVDTTAAEDLGVAVGDTLTITYPETGRTSVRIVGTFGKGQLINATYVIPLADFADNYTSQLDANILMTHAPGADPVAAKTTIQTAVADYPNVTVNDPADITREVQAGVDQLLGMVTAMLLLAVIVAIFGIVNTLVLSVVERTREFGMIRAVGATSRQVRTVVRRESVLMAMLGALTGMGLGTVAGIALSRALVDEGITTLAVPAGTLFLYLLAAAGVGVLAAIGPARRAGKVNVLDAITAE